eukprot:GHVL01003558.1.p1 GENE.GHVL01003558.1~~GHVL01003558.1.p1  ORF type:complete len:466 (+),score=77.27 GHVL01003558.1:137-1534(+)
MSNNKRDRLVVKIGTSTIMTGEYSDGVALSNLGKIVDVCALLRQSGYDLILVSSGAVGLGVLHIGLSSRPEQMVKKQAAAAVGQCQMMRFYEDLFRVKGCKVAQLLLSRSDLQNRTRYENFFNCLNELLNLDVIPVINENDCVTTDEIRFGDNDTLAAYCAVGSVAKWIFLLTDVDGLYTKNPTIYPSESVPIHIVERINDMYENNIGSSDDSQKSASNWGTGGMATKLLAAKLATSAGIHTALVKGSHPERILQMLKFAKKVEQQKELYKMAKSAATEPNPNSRHWEAEWESAMRTTPGQGKGSPNRTDAKEKLPFKGTIFCASNHIFQRAIRNNRRWILSLPVCGKLYVDNGAAVAITKKHKSLLAAGITSVQGEFCSGECVALHQHTGIGAHDHEIARCIVNYSSQDVEKVRGLSSMSDSEDEITHEVSGSSKSISTVLGYPADPEVAHRSNIVCFESVEQL